MTMWVLHIFNPSRIMQQIFWFLKSVRLDVLSVSAAPWDDGGGDGVSHLAIVAGQDTAEITKNDQ